MAFGDAVYVVAQVQRKKGHVQHAFATEDFLHVVDLAPAHYLVDQFHWEFVMRGWNRSMRRENATPAHRVQVRMVDFVSAVGARMFVEQFEHEQARMTFVHVVTLDPSVAKEMQHPHATDSKDNFLANAVVLVTTVKIISK